MLSAIYEESLGCGFSARPLGTSALSACLRRDGLLRRGWIHLVLLLLAQSILPRTLFVVTAIAAGLASGAASYLLLERPIMGAGRQLHRVRAEAPLKPCET